MSLDRTGTFRGVPLEWGVDAKEPKEKRTDGKKLVWFHVRVRLTEFYDQQENQWFNYAEKEAEIIAYLCLFGAIKKKGSEIGPTLSYDQVKKVFGWDGASFAALANGDYSELQFQLRIGDNTWEEAKTPYQVDWIDENDVDPNRQLRKLDAKELKDLDKQYAALLNRPPVKAATAKKSEKPHPARVPADDGKPPTAAEKKAAQRAKSERIKAANKAEAEAKLAADVPAPPTPPEPPEAVDPPEALTTAPPAENSCTKQQAWEAIVEMRDPTINDETIKELWNSAIEEVAGPEAVTKVGMKKVTEEQWFQVKEIVLKDCAKF